MQQRIPQLDAVRGVAILLVMLHNIGEKYPSFHLQFLFKNGWMGVDLFFVLSGFLITGILLDTKRSKGYFKNFYVRRCLRIWPLYFSLLLFMFAILPALRPSEAHTIFEKSSPWWAFPLFLQNFLIPISTNAAGPLGVTWSLAIEEQFYVIWPVVVRFCSRAWLYRIAITELCLSPALRFYLSVHHVYLYTNVFCRLDGLMAGALLALVIRSESFVPSRFIRLAWFSFFMAAPLAFVSEFLNAGWIVFSLTAVASAAFVYLSLFSSPRWLRMILRNKFLVYTGTISYGLYLLHKIPIGFVESFRLDRHPFLALLLILVTAYAMATLSWNLLEKPFLRLKRYFEARPVMLDQVEAQISLKPEARERD